MAHFLRGLNYNIVHMEEVYPYADCETLCNLCLKVES